MIIDRAIDVQTAVLAHLGAALDPIQVTAEPTGEPRYVRVDSFTAVNDEQYRNHESSTHRFSVNAFDSPEGGTRSLAWVWNALRAANAAMKSLRIEGVEVVAEDAQAWLNPAAAEGVFNAQGFIRYRVQLGA